MGFSCFFPHGILRPDLGAAAEQDSKSIDAQRISAERQRVHEEVRRTTAEKERVQAEIYDAEIAVAQKQAEVRSHPFDSFNLTTIDSECDTWSVGARHSRVS